MKELNTGINKPKQIIHTELEEKVYVNLNEGINICQDYKIHVL